MSIVFYFLAAITIIGALGVVVSTNVVHSALFLVISFIGVAAIYFYIGAEFLGAVQLMVYSGAVAVLIVMAIMLTRRDSMAQSNPSQKLFRRVVTGLLAGGFFFLIGLGIVLSPLPGGELGASTGAQEIAAACRYGRCARTREGRRYGMIGLPDLLFVAAVLFCIGLYGLLTRRGIIPILMCVELMLNAVNINLIAFDRFYAHNMEGQLMALFSIAVAASEIAVGLALAFRLYQIRFTTNVDELDTLRD